VCFRRPRRSAAGARFARLAVLSLALLLAPAAAAAEPAFHRDQTLLPKSLRTSSTQAVGHAASTGGTLARTFAGLAIVLAVVFATYWLLRTYARGKRGKGDGKIEVLATTPLAPNRSVHLLRVGDVLILVGSAEGGITRLKTYSPEESDLVQAQLDGGSDPLWPLSGGGAAARRGLVEELRRRTVRS
jgi:flagellar protein FliO/FliZ